MSDKEYLYAFLKLSQEEKESLMVSEAERRRTFAAHWPIESIVKANGDARLPRDRVGVASTRTASQLRAHAARAAGRAGATARLPRLVFSLTSQCFHCTVMLFTQQC